MSWTRCGICKTAYVRRGNSFLPACNCAKNRIPPPPQEESVVLEGDCAELGEMIAEAAFPSIPSGPVRITISPLKENKTDDK